LFADVAFGAFDFDSKLSNFDEREFRRAVEKMTDEFPNLKAVVSTVREVHSASRHDLSAVCFYENQIYKARDYKNIEVFDRVGSGDAFVAGFIYGCLAGKGAQYSVDCGAALGALAMTTPGDNSAATLTEVENLMAGGSGIAQR
jgi:2-dehydro-3-deoxygluconokinase